MQPIQTSEKIIEKKYEKQFEVMNNSEKMGGHLNILKTDLEQLNLDEEEKNDLIKINGLLKGGDPDATWGNTSAVVNIAIENFKKKGKNRLKAYSLKYYTDKDKKNTETIEARVNRLKEKIKERLKKEFDLVLEKEVKKLEEEKQKLKTENDRKATAALKALEIFQGKINTITKRHEGCKNKRDSLLKEINTTIEGTKIKTLEEYCTKTDEHIKSIKELKNDEQTLLGSLKNLNDYTLNEESSEKHKELIDKKNNIENAINQSRVLYEKETEKLQNAKNELVTADNLLNKTSKDISKDLKSMKGKAVKNLIDNLNDSKKKLKEQSNKTTKFSYNIH